MVTFMSDEWLALFEIAARETLLERDTPALPERIVMEELFRALPPAGDDTGYRLVIEGGDVRAVTRIDAVTGDADVAITVDGALAVQLAALTHGDARYVALREAADPSAFTFTGDPDAAAALGAALDGLHDRMAASTTG